MKTETPRTDELLTKLRNEPKPDVWATDDVQALLSLCRRLEREFSEANRQAVLYNTDTMKVMEQRDQWKAMARDLFSIMKAMDDDLNFNLPEYERLEGVTEIMDRFNQLNKL